MCHCSWFRGMLWVPPCAYYKAIVSSWRIFFLQNIAPKKDCGDQWRLIRPQNSWSNSFLVFHFLLIKQSRPTIAKGYWNHLTHLCFHLLMIFWKFLRFPCQIPYLPASCKFPPFFPSRFHEAGFPVWPLLYKQLSRFPDVHNSWKMDSEAENPQL